jgi:hypothetical protein
MDAFVASFLSILPVMGTRSCGNSSGFSLALFAIFSALAISPVLVGRPSQLHRRAFILDPRQLFVDGVRGSSSSLRQHVQCLSGIRCEVDVHLSTACNRFSNLVIY